MSEEMEKNLREMGHGNNVGRLVKAKDRTLLGRVEASEASSRRGNQQNGEQVTQTRQGVHEAEKKTEPDSKVEGLQEVLGKARQPTTRNR